MNPSALGPAPLRRSPRARTSAWGALLPAAALALLLLSPSRAGAFERQWHVGADLGYTALLFNSASAQHGFGGGFHLTYGLNDTFNLIGELNVSDHPGGSWLLAGGGVGLGYVVDILQWVPYVGVVAGAYDLANIDPKCGTKTRVACNGARANVELPFGLDYTVSRSFAIGLGGRYQFLLSTATPVSAISVFARVEYLWGY